MREASIKSAIGMYKHVLKAEHTFTQMQTHDEVFDYLSLLGFQKNNVHIIEGNLTND